DPAGSVRASGLGRRRRLVGTQGQPPRTRSYRLSYTGARIRRPTLVHIRCRDRPFPGLAVRSGGSVRPNRTRSRRRSRALQREWSSLWLDGMKTCHTIPYGPVPEQPAAPLLCHNRRLTVYRRPQRPHPEHLGSSVPKVNPLAPRSAALYVTVLGK